MPSHLLPFVSLLLHTAVALQVQNPPTTTAPPSASPQKRGEASSFIVAGYLPDYQLDRWSGPADSLTDLIYFGLTLSNDGRFEPTALSKKHAKLLKEKKTAAGHRLLFALGGWNKSAGFAKLTADARLREQFIEAAKTFCLEHGFDGIDYDWEHPQGEQEIKSYALLLQETHKAFAPHKLIVTVALASWQDLGQDAYAAVDRVHLMSYDHDFPQATLEKSTADVERLLKAGCPANKIVLGIPFYGRNQEGQAQSYAKLTKVEAVKNGTDIVNGFAINGPATVAAKVQLAREKKLAGIMIWELAQDGPGDQSLLRTIRNELKAHR